MKMRLNVSEDFISQLLKEGNKEGITINVIEQKVQSKDNLLTASKLKKELRIGDDISISSLAVMYGINKQDMSDYLAGRKKNPRGNQIILKIISDFKIR